MINTLTQFIQRCELATNAQIYQMFEFDCSDTVRNEVYYWAVPGAPEPFRSAMYNLGFVNY